MNRNLFARVSGLFALILLYAQVQAQVPQLTINDKVDPAVYLSKLIIDVKVTGNVAVTNMTMTFTNKTNRLLEGELVFPLPEGITVSRYALDINGKLREAVPVEKARAAQVFEDIERRRIDPGLLERVEGNNFRTRIYPIPAHGSRTIAVGYEEELPLAKSNALRYHLNLDHAKPVDEFRLDVSVVQSPVRPEVDDEPDAGFIFKEWKNNWTASVKKENFAPRQPLTFHIPRQRPDEANVVMQQAGANFYFLLNSFPGKQTRARKPVSNISVIWDASLSNHNRDLKKELELLQQYFRNKNMRVSLYLLNNSFKKAGEFDINAGEWSLLKKALESVTYDGGTDFSKLQFTGGDEYLFFTDGMATLGYKDELPSAPVFTITSSPRADFSYLQFMAQRSGGACINLSKHNVQEAQQLLNEETLQFIGIKQDPRISETYPSIPTQVVNGFSLAGISTEHTAEVTLQFGYGKTVVMEKTIHLDFNQQYSGNTIPGSIWAQKKIAELDYQYENNKEMITLLGKQFSIVTRNTSLIVLETVNDYVLYEIEPPVELREQYDHMIKQGLSQRQNRQQSALTNALGYVNQLAGWWNQNFLSHTTPKVEKTEGTPNLQDNGRTGVPGNTRQTTERTAGSFSSLDSVVVGFGTQKRRDITGAVAGKVSGVDIRARGLSSNDDDARANNPSSSISVKYWTPDRPYLKQMAAEKKSARYSRYLKIRESYFNVPTFYYDMAQFFFQQQDTATALMILTNMAEIDIENHELYKLLGYKLREAGNYEEAVYIFRKVLQWRPLEPQSYRDYGLALADAGKYQQALDTLYAALEKNYESSVDGLYRGFEEIIVTEMNQLVAVHKDKLDLSQIDRKLVHEMPVDVRVVLSWNKRDTDMDLWVVDPNGEKCYYGHKSTLTGGRISNDFTQGYGPEQYMLKKALAGKYQVLVNYFGDGQVTVSGPATVVAEIFTNYADGRQERKMITMQMEMANRTNGVLVGEFIFDGDLSLKK